MKNFKPLIVIPLYNHAAAVKKVVDAALAYYNSVLIVDDGSTDGGAGSVTDPRATVIRHEKNKGKGAAILTAAKWAKENNFTHIVSIDADGQHYPRDIGKLLDAAKEHGHSIIIGKRNFEDPSVPRASKFGRKFSGFWAKVQTSKTIIDMQSGFRVYPLEIFGKYKIYAKGFGFEIEAVIKALWAGFGVEEVEVGVHYPDKKSRISHFSFIKDNAKLGILNTYLTIRAMMPFPHRKFIENEKGEVISLNPFKVVVGQMKKKENPLHLGVSAAWGSFWGALALPGIRTMILFVGVGWFNLNRAVAFSVDKLAIPPFIPFVCIETGYFLRHGEFLTTVSWKIIGTQFFQRVWEWMLGSLIVAPVFALIVGLAVFVGGHILRKGVIYASEMDG